MSSQGFSKFGQKSAGSRLAVAFDFESRDEVFVWAKKLAGLDVVIKLGLGVLPHLTPKDFAELKAQGFALFIDVKLHDIPTQVARAVKSWIRLGADYITLHTAGASQMISEAVKAAQGTSCQLLGVTVLTSLGRDHCTEIGFDFDSQVERLVKLSLRCGLDGFVCPPAEASKLKSLATDLGLRAFVCTPGLVLDETETRSDQPNTWTVARVMDGRSDLLVLGRSILNAEDPRAATERALKIIEQKKA